MTALPRPKECRGGEVLDEADTVRADDGSAIKDIAALVAKRACGGVVRQGAEAIGVVCLERVTA